MVKLEQIDLDNIISAINNRSKLTSPTFSGTVTLPATTSIGLVTNTEIGYLDGVTSNIQTQLNTKANLVSPTFSGTVVLPATTSIGVVSNVEIGYLDGATSNIQTQIGTKANLASPTLTGTPTAPTPAIGDNTNKIATTAFVLANGGGGGAGSSSYTGLKIENGTLISLSSFNLSDVDTTINTSSFSVNDSGELIITV